ISRARAAGAGADGEGRGLHRPAPLVGLTRQVEAIAAVSEEEDDRRAAANQDPRGEPSANHRLLTRRVAGGHGISFPAGPNPCQGASLILFTNFGAGIGAFPALSSTSKKT